jgi:hypothetical protein
MKSLFFLFWCVALFACERQRALLPNTEYVLTKGMTVRATNPNGTVTITAGDGAARVFSGDGWSKSRTLIPRTTRWYGSLGLYDPGSSSSPGGRLLADEGRLFFKTESEALRYLYSGSAHFKPVYTNQGLIVGYDMESIPGHEPVRSVQIWQIYINGKRPNSLRGANDSAILVENGTIPDTAAPNPAPTGYEMILGEKEYVPDVPKK